MAKLISGKEVSAQIRQKIKEEAQALRENSGIQPGLAVILVGNDPGIPDLRAQQAESLRGSGLSRI